MSIAELFEKARAEGRALLFGCMPAGFPTVEGSIAAMRAMAEAGVDVIEIELPYSDPVMDGPVIQRASDIALANGVRIADRLRIIEAVAARGSPGGHHDLLESLYRYGIERFARDLASAGGTGLITPDLIPEEAGRVARRVRRVRPGPHLPRLALLDRRADRDDRRALPGVCLRHRADGRHRRPRPGVAATAPALVERVRALTDMPVGVGLGVGTGAQAREVVATPTAVIVGSALIRCCWTRLTRQRAGSGFARVSAELAEGVRAVERAVTGRTDA